MARRRRGFGRTTQQRAKGYGKFWPGAVSTAGAGPHHLDGAPDLTCEDGILRDGLIIKGVNADYLSFYLGLAIIIAMAANTYVGRVRRRSGVAGAR